MKSESGTLLLESAGRALADTFPDEMLRAGAFRASPPVGWSVIEQLEIQRALVGESAGGFDLKPGEALGVVRLCGQIGAPLPLAETMLAYRLAEIGGLETPSHGPATIAIGSNLKIEPEGDGWRVSGTLKHVPWGEAARTLLTVVRHHDHNLMIRLTHDSWTVEPGDNLAGLPRDDLTVQASIPASAAAAAPPDWGPQHVLMAGAVLRAIEIAGAIDTVLRMTLEYLAQRQQFGRPLSQFQVLQHEAAKLAEQAVVTAAAADIAVDAFASLDLLAIATAKARASEAAGQAAALAHQMHGAMGFTQELTISHFTKLLYSWREEFGAETYWQEQLGEATLNSAPDDLWAFITATDQYS